MKSFIFTITIILFLVFSMSTQLKTTSNSLISVALPHHTHFDKRNLNNTVSDSSEQEEISQNGITNIANMINERGFYKSNGFSFDNQEIVNDFNGNLMYQIPLYKSMLAGDLNFDLSLNYNGSVGHQFFIGNLNTYVENSRRYNLNVPSWILSLNGIAIQAFNFETYFFTNPTRNQLTGDSIRLIIPGYHFDGPLVPPDAGNPNRILILAGDGSLISLENKYNDTSYIGTYSYEGKEMHYKAQVNYIESGFYGYRKRKVVLLRGDGSEFVFMEHKRDFTDFPISSIVNVRRKPMMLLLEEIKDHYGHNIKIKYDGASITDGRPLLDEVIAVGYSKDTLKMKFLFGSPDQCTGIQINNNSDVNGNYNFYFDTPVTLYPIGNIGGYNIRNHKASISRIKNTLNQNDTNKYEKYIRTFNNLPSTNQSGDVDLIDTLKRINFFSSDLQKKIYYAYTPPRDIAVTFNASNPQLKSNYYYGYGRDLFYTNMMNTRTVCDKNTAKTYHAYSYSYTTSGSGIDIDTNDQYRSFHTEYSLDPQSNNSSKDSIQTLRFYRVYPISSDFPANIEEPDVQGIIKILYDSTYNYNESTIHSIDKNYYNYERGSLSNNIYTGSFLLLKKWKINSNIEKLWSYDYEYKDGNSNYDSVLISEQETDPLSNYTKVTYENFYKTGLIHKKMSNSLSEINSSNSNDTSIFYKIQMPLEEKKYDQNLYLLSRKTYTYITNESDNAGYYGQLKNQKLYNSDSPSEFILSEYEYYKNDFSGNAIYTGDFYPFKEGNIKMIKNPVGQETKYYYTPQTASEVVQTSGQNPKLKFLIKYNNGSVIEESEDIWDGRLPIRTDNCFNDGTSTIILLSTYQSYAVDGSPKKKIDQSKYLTQINYEPIHRVNSIILPGDFTSNSSTFTIKYNSDNVLNTINVLRYRNTVTPEFSKIKYSIDGFGNVKEKDVFISNSDSNVYLYKFNFMNKPARNFDALNDSTMFSYDGLSRSIKTKTSDLNFTTTEYSYQNSLTYYFDATYTGFVEKQYFTDEENNHFEKYFDAVGNLLREVKYAYEEPSDAEQVDMVTDYKYDSLYRLTKVKTPEGKFISYSYDGYGRQSVRITPDAGRTNYFYDKNNNLIFIQDENQRFVNNNKYTFKNYDGMNRLTGTGEAILQPDSPNDESQYQPSTPDEYLTVNVYDTLTSSIVNNLFNPPSDYYSSPNYTRGNLVSAAYRTRNTDSWNFKYYRYDERNRVIKMWNFTSGLPEKEVSYTYNSQDQITNVYYNTGTDYKRYIYRYDFAGRLDTVNYYFGEEGTDVSSLYKNFTNYEYNENSLIEYQNYGGTFLTNSYLYNNRNWVTQLYNSISQFVFDNDYYKNGNVKSQYFYGSYRDYFTNADDLYFKYSYDRSNRLTNVSNEITQDNTYHLENTYDKDGNITKLIRYGDNNTIKDNFNYEYNSGTNKLNNVSGSKDQFSYDYNGNMIDDKLNNNYNVLYDYRNLITEIYHKEGQAPTRVTLYATRYYYDETGNRIRKLIYTNIDENAGPVLDWNNLSNPGNGWILFQNEFYIRGINGNELATYNDTTFVEWYVHGNGIEGKIKGTTGYYYYKDHLGSVRAVVSDNGDLVSAQDYDVCGYLLQNRIYDSDSTKFKFTGKERDVESSYDYFGARYYDSRIGRWGTIDPLLSNEPSKTPYHYTSNNPINRIDPHGLDDYYYSEGKWIDYNERSWFHNFFVGDRYYVQSDQGDVEYKGNNYFQALSQETVRGNWVFVDAQWGNSDFTERVSSAISGYDENKINRWDYTYKESHEYGLMDQKHNLKQGGEENASKYLYVYNNIALNWREAGNAIWGKSMRQLGFSFFEAYSGAQIYSLKKWGHFDQTNEVNAFKVGYFNASYKLNSLWSNEWIR